MRNGGQEPEVVEQCFAASRIVQYLSRLLSTKIVHFKPFCYLFEYEGMFLHVNGNVDQSMGLLESVQTFASLPKQPIVASIGAKKGPLRQTLGI